MKRSRWVWPSFAACAAVLLAVLAWLSWTAVRLERARQAADADAQREERIRLALWRMDAALMSLIAREGARPVEHYQATYEPPRLAWPPPDGAVEQPVVRLLSPLADANDPLVLLYFRLKDGYLTSPQLWPQSDSGSDAGRADLLGPDATPAGMNLLAMRSAIDPVALLARLPDPPSGGETGAAVAMNGTNTANNPNFNTFTPVTNGNEARTQQEFQFRQNVTNQVNWDNARNTIGPTRLGLSDGEARALWAGRDHDKLLLARKVRKGGQTVVVGCWLNWPAVRDWLRQNVADLLPSADLAPVPSPTSLDEESGRMLATLPVRLVPGRVPVEADADPAGTLWWLGAAWVGVLLAAGAVAVLLHGALELGERRGRFVSAVTHELRTPLTTLRMYTEMLADGQVTQADRQQRYVRTLHGETDRLCRLVENVLVYSRLQASAAARKAGRHELAGLLASVQPRLAARAEQARMELMCEGEPAGAVRADPQAFEQILMNLVDNACKYAGRAEDRRIHVRVGRGGSRATVRVCDHGPGLPAGERRRVFRPFIRARRDQAGSQGGVGLGLAICRQLARGMGAELVLADGDDGACFELRMDRTD